MTRPIWGVEFYIPEVLHYKIVKALGEGILNRILEGQPLHYLVLFKVRKRLDEQKVKRDLIDEEWELKYIVGYMSGSD
jgi:hypothetical protein